MRPKFLGWPKFRQWTKTAKIFLLMSIACLSILATQLLLDLSIQQPAKANEIGTNWLQASFPVENFAEYTSPFGPRGGDFHYGLDLAAPMGSYIRSWWAGTLTKIIDDRRCGIGLVIESGDWEHIYCHIQGEAVQSDGINYLVDREGGIILTQGQTLPAGARIARVGMSGRTTGPHLHWGLKYGGEWVDPALVLTEMYEQQANKLSMN